MHKSLKALLLAGLLAFPALLSAGCASKPKSTVMQVQDYELVGNDIGQQLADAMATNEVFASRNADSPRMVIAMQKVVNLTSDQMSAGAKWYLMYKVRSSSGIQKLGRERNIAFVIAAEDLQRAKQIGSINAEIGAERAPTHVMSATFKSTRRTGDEARTDLYYATFEITDLATGEIIWSGDVAFKRIGFGKSYD